MRPPDRTAARAAVDRLLIDDSDLVGQAELARLALAKDLLDLPHSYRQRPAIAAFLEQVTRDVLVRSAPFDDPCPGGPDGHTWQAVEGRLERTWPVVAVRTDEQFDGRTVCISGQPSPTDAGAGPVLLRCSRPGCGTERYVPFDCDVQWSM